MKTEAITEVNEIKKALKIFEEQSQKKENIVVKLIFEKHETKDER